MKCFKPGYSINPETSAVFPSSGWPRGPSLRVCIVHCPKDQGRTASWRLAPWPRCVTSGTTGTGFAAMSNIAGSGDAEQTSRCRNEPGVCPRRPLAVLPGRSGCTCVQLTWEGC